MLRLGLPRMLRGFVQPLESRGARQPRDQVDRAACVGKEAHLYDAPEAEGALRVRNLRD